MLLLLTAWACEMGLPLETEIYKILLKVDLRDWGVIPTYCVVDLGLEVEAFRETRCGCSSLGCRVRVDQIGQDCELEISKILLRLDPRD